MNIFCSGIVHLTDESGKPTSTGFAQADAVYKQLVEWDLIKEIKCLVFDTTASNSGYLQGAAIRLQNLLKVPVFYLVSCHYVMVCIICSHESLFGSGKCLMLLVGKLPDDKSFSFKKCDARHKASLWLLEYIVRK